MNLTTLTSSDLKRIGKLLAEREAIQAELQKVDRQLAAFEHEGAAPAAKPAKAAKAHRVAKRSKRGAMKEAIIAMVKGAGKGGVKIGEIAAKLGVKYGNVAAWFNSTGKKVKEIKKIAKARYAWAG